MTTQELRLYFLQEHRRDRKLTIINYAIISIGILILFGLIAALFIYTEISASEVISEAFGGQEHDPWYVNTYLWLYWQDVSYILFISCGR